MRRILHSITGLGVGGAQCMLVRYLSSALRHDCPATVLSLMPLGGLAAAIESDGSAKLVSLGMKTGTVRVSDTLRLGRAVRKLQPDVIHGWMYHGNVAGILGAWASLDFAPVIWSIHHSINDIAREKPLTQRLIRLSSALSRFTSAISYCSPVSAAQHEAIGFDPRRRRIIPNGTDCAFFRPTEERKGRLRALLDIPADRLIIGHVARFHPMKDQVTLVLAIADLISSGHDVQLVVIGEGHIDGPVRQTAERAGISERVTTLGLRHDVAEVMPDLDIYALSSAWGETFPLAAGEAMASGVPVVTTDIGDTAWLVGSTGIVVPPRQPAALADGLARMIALGPERRRALGAAARQRIIEHFSLDQYVKAHLDLYDEVSREPPPRARLHAA